MTKDLIKLLISEYQAYVSQVDLIPREVELVDGLNYVFVGLRHAGKSYLMFQRIAQLISKGYRKEDILYFNFEDDRIDSLGVEDLDLIKTCYEEMYDSVQYSFLTRYNWWIDGKSLPVGWLTKSIKCTSPAAMQKC